MSLWTPNWFRTDLLKGHIFPGSPRPSRSLPLPVTKLESCGFSALTVVVLDPGHLSPILDCQTFGNAWGCCWHQVSKSQQRRWSPYNAENSPCNTELCVSRHQWCRAEKWGLPCLFFRKLNFVLDSSLQQQQEQKPQYQLFIPILIHFWYDLCSLNECVSI